ncbi:hypothetical protein [Desulfobacula toluolica]|uniref:Uncharacterized protein n=1 Tax=Desulfobacula toluolica (strain DSM 7467 / Tol2) TaxID=651182 RepID=K0NPU3_DESTT|nr:hypothetical protein [Desulfobacula toluolica]CCK82168.1 uncharacterized protein TOL2_C40130 [Desulfobacula toluolica Tol2]
MDYELYSKIKDFQKLNFNQRKKTLCSRLERRPKKEEQNQQNMGRIPWFRDWIPMWNNPETNKDEFLISLIAWQFPNVTSEELIFIEENLNKLVEEAIHGPAVQYRDPFALITEITLAYSTGFWKNEPVTPFTGDTVLLEFILIAVNVINNIKGTVKYVWGQEDFVIRNDYIDPISLAMEAVNGYFTPDPASRKSISSWNPENQLLIDHFLIAICGTFNYQQIKANELAAGHYRSVLDWNNLLIYLGLFAEMVFENGLRIDFDPKGHSDTDWIVTAQAKFKVPYGVIKTATKNEDEEAISYPTDQTTEEGEDFVYQYTGGNGESIAKYGLRGFIKCGHCSKSATVKHPGWATPLQRKRNLGSIYYEPELPSYDPTLSRKQARQRIEDEGYLHCPYCHIKGERINWSRLAVKLKYSNIL